MQYTEILSLLEKGFTPEQVMQLTAAPSPAPDPAPAPAPEPAPAPDPAPVPAPAPAPAERPEWVDELNANLKRMTQAVQAQGILNSQQPEVKPESVDDIMAAMIAPPARKAQK